MLPSVWTTTTWAWATGRESEPGGKWQVAVNEFQPKNCHLLLSFDSLRSLVIQDKAEMTMHHAVFQKLSLTKTSPVVSSSDQINGNQSWSSDGMFVGQIVKTHMFVEHVSRNVRIVRVWVSVYTPTCLVGWELQLSKVWPGKKKEIYIVSHLQSISKDVFCLNLLSNRFAKPPSYMGTGQKDRPLDKNLQFSIFY